MIFRYLIKELVPQFISTLIVFCAIIVISQLVRLSEVLIAFGLSFENVFLPFLYIILPFLTIVIPISFFFAVMIAFSRLSSDGELTAILSAGSNLKSVAVPVVIVAAILYFVGSSCAMYLEAWGRREFVQFQYQKTQTELDNMIRFKMQEGVFLKDFIGYVIFAEKISSDRSKFENIMMAPKSTGDTKFYIFAPHAEITGAVESADLRMSFFDGRTTSINSATNETNVADFKKVEMDLLTIFQKQIFGDDYKKDDYRSYTPRQLMTYIDTVQSDENEQSNYLKARFLLHFRIASPFAIMGFAFLGIVFGFQGQRHSKNYGYVSTILTIMISYVFSMGFKWLAENGHVEAPLAAWFPHVMMMFFGMFLVIQKDRLPMSESPIAFRNLPYIGHLFEH